MAEMIGRELRFITPRITRKRRRHHPRVIHDNIDRIRRFKHTLGESVDRSRIEQVHWLQYNIRHSGQRRRRLR
ncbi:hypothetical protein D9M72_485840 [compost metagenome]